MNKGELKEISVSTCISYGLFVGAGDKLSGRGGSSGGEGVPGGQDPPPPPFGGPPNCIKRGKNVERMRAKTPHFST